MLQLNYEGLKNRDAWEKADVRLPDFNPEALAEKTDSRPKWLHIGPGNIFRGYVAVLAQQLIESGEMDTSIVVASPTGPSTPESQYWPFDNLALQVKMFADGKLEKTVVGSIAKAVDAQDAESVNLLRQMAEYSGLQLISFTITEKGYQIRGMDGSYQKTVQADIDAGPDAACYGSAMSLVTALLWRRFNSSRAPIALVSMDNFSHNGDKLKDSVRTIAAEWQKQGRVTEEFEAWISADRVVAFPWSVIDKITPGPDKRVADMLLDQGLAVGRLGKSRSGSPAAGFVNAEAAEYLVIEDLFPNGRPAFESVGVYMSDRETVDKFEKMKVCSCLNPLHTAMAVIGCLLKFDTISSEMQDKAIVDYIKGIGYTESLPYVADPGIVEPKAFLDTIIEERLPNPYIPDTPQRIATDTSQKVGIRFGETIRRYAEAGEVDRLRFIPFAIASWCRYLLGLDDDGEAFDVSPDPLLEDLQAYLKDCKLGEAVDLKVLEPILSHEELFRNNLIEVGLGDRILGYFNQMTEGPGAVRKSLEKLIEDEA